MSDELSSVMFHDSIIDAKQHTIATKYSKKQMINPNPPHHPNENEATRMCVKARPISFPMKSKSVIWKNEAISCIVAKRQKTDKTAD